MSHGGLTEVAELNAYAEQQTNYPTNKFNPIVAKSWKRCQELRSGLDQTVRAEINARELKQRIDAYSDLVEVATPTMENIRNFVARMDFQIALSDNHGYLLKVINGESQNTRPENVPLNPGANWAESFRGTNAIGTCLVEKRPVKIRATEHFIEKNRSLTCSAAPIFSSDGDLLAVLNLTGGHSSDNDFTLGMVVAGANAIENQLQLHQINTKLLATHRYSDSIIHSMSEGLICVDSTGRITQLNAVAAKIIGVRAQPSLGKNIAEILGPDTPILTLLKNGVSYDQKEIAITAGRRTFYSSAKLLRDDYGNNIGAVAILRNSDAVKNVPSQGRTVQNSYYCLNEIIGKSDGMLRVKEMAAVAAKNDSTVLIQGDSGTGKELVAQGIHNAGTRCDKPFVAVNCAAITETLLESELFGYSDGAFTGAKKGGRPGKIETAHGGTLFLDEIGDMPLSMQVKLLRVLQERRISRVGSTRETFVDFRVVAATHRDLKTMVNEGTFRKDLYYRLNVLPITIPPLCERLDDLSLLVHLLVEKLSERLDKGQVEIAGSFLQACRLHDWPGNIRELENAIERALCMIEANGELTEKLLELDSIPLPASEQKTSKLRSLKDVEMEAITTALSQSRGNIALAASFLEVSRNTVYRKIKDYDIVV